MHDKFRPQSTWILRSASKNKELISQSRRSFLARGKDAAIFHDNQPEKRYWQTGCKKEFWGKWHPLEARGNGLAASLKIKTMKPLPRVSYLMFWLATKTVWNAVSNLLSSGTDQVLGLGRMRRGKILVFLPESLPLFLAGAFHSQWKKCYCYIFHLLQR